MSVGSIAVFKFAHVRIRGLNPGGIDFEFKSIIELINVYTIVGVLLRIVVTMLRGTIYVVINNHP